MTASRAKRSAGLLLHPTSLPGPFGIGDLGPAARTWVDQLARAGQSWWQMLPLVPVGFGNSPYQGLSAFAGNPQLLSPELLVADGLLDRSDLAGPDLAADRVDFERVAAYKRGLLGRAWERFRAGAAPALRPAFEEYCVREAGWLTDFALFTALRDAHVGVPWTDWPRPLVRREPAALEEARRSLGDAAGMHQFGQFLFARQWGALREYAHGKGIRLIGDLPIFVSPDSADVWANPDLFQLDAERRPRVVAGVPPDYFSATGQLWGNPLYDWEALRRTGYAWWVARLKATLAQVDVVRVDHFRGFEAYWEIPAGHPTAEKGQWVQAPGAELFAALRAGLGGLPVIAEDLGLITPAVVALREQFGLPGMRVLQFAFGGGADNPYLPHNYEPNTVAYTGTHDNDTSAGWYAALAPQESGHVRRYAPGIDADPAGGLLRLAWGSVADVAIAPLQDVLRLGSAARMNVPGQPAGNWGWRYAAGMVTEAVLDELRGLTELFDRGTG